MAFFTIRVNNATSNASAAQNPSIPFAEVDWNGGGKQKSWEVYFHRVIGYDLLCQGRAYGRLTIEPSPMTLPRCLKRCFQ